MTGKTKGWVADKKRLSIRKNFWPDIDEKKLWNRKAEKGFFTVPRYLSYIMEIMDKLSKGKPLSSTYFALWCHSFDESLVIIKNPREMALESGFQGQRAETTWKGRMKCLLDLKFIEAAKGSSGEYNYVLILHPYLVVSSLNEKMKSIEEDFYQSLIGRMLEIGALKQEEEE